MGLEKPDSGTLDIGETVRFGYYSQEGLQFDEQMKEWLQKNTPIINLEKR